MRLSQETRQWADKHLEKLKQQPDTTKKALSALLAIEGFELSFNEWSIATRLILSAGDPEATAGLASLYKKNLSAGNMKLRNIAFDLLAKFSPNELETVEWDERSITSLFSLRLSQEVRQRAEQQLKRQPGAAKKALSALRTIKGSELSFSEWSIATRLILSAGDPEATAGLASLYKKNLSAANMKLRDMAFNLLAKFFPDELKTVK